MEAHGRRVVEHAAAAGRPLALIVVDIDHFKAFNDRFGHAAGDKALKRIALEIMAAARVSDFTYRFGGEEFVISPTASMPRMRWRSVSASAAAPPAALPLPSRKRG